MTQEQAELLDQMLVVLYQRGYTNPNYRIFADEMAVLLNIKVKQVESYWETFFANSKFHELPIADYIDIPGSRSLRVNSNTNAFYNYGGFTKLFEEKKQKDADELRLKQLHEQKLLNDLATFRITKKQYLWNKWLAIGSIIISLIALGFQFIKK